MLTIIRSLGTYPHLFTLKCYNWKLLLILSFYLGWIHLCPQKPVNDVEIGFLPTDDRIVNTSSIIKD